MARYELALWVNDESSEGQSYRHMMGRVEEPWILIVLQLLAHDEDANAEILRTVLAETH